MLPKTLAIFKTAFLRSFSEDYHKILSDSPLTALSYAALNHILFLACLGRS